MSCLEEPFEVIIDKMNNNIRNVRVRGDWKRHTCLLIISRMCRQMTIIITLLKIFFVFF